MRKSLAMAGPFIIGLISIQGYSDSDCKKARPDSSKLQQTSPKCREAFKNAEDCCTNPTRSECGYKITNGGVPEKLPSEGSYGAAVQESARLMKARNENNAFASLCKSARKKAGKICSAELSRTLDEISSASTSEQQKSAAKVVNDTDDFRVLSDNYVAELESCHRRQAAQNDRDLIASLATSNAAMGDSQWRATCQTDRIGDDETTQCYLYNDAQSSGNFVTGKERDDLPVRSVALDGCSGYTDEAGNLTTAAHCTQLGNMPESARRNPNGETEVAIWKNPRGSDYSDSTAEAAIKNGLHYDDAKGYQKTDVNDPSFEGKPYYTLARDPNMSSGCAVREQILACSDSALVGIRGVGAEVQGYPGDYFYEANPRDKQSEVLVTRGPAYYDAYSGKLNVNTYVGPGNSGGPVYFPSQTNIGGFVSDRPVIAGPASTAQFSRDPVTNLPSDGAAISYSQRTGGVPIPIYKSGTTYIVQQAIDSTLLKGGSIFTNPPKLRGAR